MLNKYIHPGIKRPLLVFIATLLGVSTILVASEAYKVSDQDSFRRTEVEIRKWKSRIDEANRNNQILVDHEDNFFRLKDKAVIGDENRLSWVEVIQREANDHSLVSVKYNIASQELDSRENLKSDFAGIDVFRSMMSLDMKLLHEGDFLAIMDALKDAKGLFVADDCNIELLNPGGEPSALEDNIKATCDLSWYTMKKSGKG
jgi:hypothetical protein